MSSSSASKSAVAASVKSVCAGSQAVSDSAHHTAARVQSLFSEDDSFIIQVKKKLKSLKEYKGIEANELHSFAKSLVSEEELFCKFSHLVDLEDVVKEGTFDKDRVVNLENSKEMKAAKEREQMRFDRVARLNLTVCLRPLQRFHTTEGIPQDNEVIKRANFFDMEYGGRHAAILVGDVLLEWTTDDLVIPRRVDASDSFTFEGCVQNESGEYFNDMISRRPNLKEDLKPFQEEGEILCKTVEIKKKVIMKIIEVIATYNKCYYFNKVSRNCQKFVKDVIDAIQITGCKFSIEDQQYIQQVKEGRVRIASLKSYRSHEELNTFISSLISRNELDELKKEELDILVRRYKQFHGEKECTEPSCKYETVLHKAQSLSI